MKFATPAQDGTFLKRYKRFFADIEWQGQVITAHVPNTGSLKSCLRPGAPCRFTISDDPQRKLKYTLQMIKPGEGWIGVNTALPNSLVWSAWQDQMVSHWRPFDGAQREVKIHANTRLDMVLWQSNRHLANDTKITSLLFSSHKFHFVEVKNVTLAENGAALFPDAVTTRGQKHLVDLMSLIDQGHTAELLFAVQRRDVTHFAPADDIDPEYGRLLRLAYKKEVKITPFLCQLEATGIELDVAALLPVRL